ncbi:MULTISPECIES: type VII secretion integral membrane protein EccD [unclassified Streptomyces]|uniref:type VII secretion integral membrane protein EccD n=1 Tax=unclassified Streptomyces TaxID=2593676 RepID=UPI0006F6F8E3|nr:MULTISPECIES: type VII secretion integral membrane protein EccD [unclassified Streptomyces]KQX49515.1 type VII secretion integral membrane protein EccD [Streptomyces sp. Root1304]KRA79134.1 type VII secretion integral membrane protein EccD [Streptomyces sp. Root66D1]
MTETSGISSPGLCRLAVRTPRRLLDLAVPVDVPLADLLPTLLDHAGEELAEQGIEHGGWVLQRLGEEPLDEEGTPESLSLRDGETLHLRPRVEALPALHFDDLVDGVAGSMRERPHGWTARTGRWTLRATAVLLLAAAWVVCALPGGDAPTRAAVAGAIGLLVLFGAAAASRAVGDSAAGAALGVFVAPFLALAGVLLPAGEADGGGQLTGARILAASAAAAGGAVLSVAAVAAFVPLLLSVAVIALAGAVGGTLMLTLDLTPGPAAAVVAVLAVAVGGLVPGISFRLSGLRLPALPSNAEELQEGIDPHPHAHVVSRTAHAEQWMTALYAAVGLVCVAVLTALLLDDPGTPALVTAGTLCLLLLLHSRTIGNVFQRPAVFLPGLYGLLLAALTVGAGIDPGDRPVLLAVLLTLAGSTAVASWTVPGRRVLPHWGRAGDILHTCAAVALIPLVLWVLGVYGALRAVSG